MSGQQDFEASALGPNMWLVDEMYRRYREDPDSVDEKWREFFEDFRPRIGEPIPAGALADAVEATAPASGDGDRPLAPAPGGEGTVPAKVAKKPPTPSEGV